MTLRPEPLMVMLAELSTEDGARKIAEQLRDALMKLRGKDG